MVLDSSGPAKENIERLRRLGVRFTIDDFGTGNSSLNRIGSFPVSTLKIDQSFVQVLGPDGDNNALVSAIISMADRLGLDCVAEGVETSAQSRVLLQRGCTTAQGYFFSPPLPAGDIEKMMAGIAACRWAGRRSAAPPADRRPGRPGAVPLLTIASIWRSHPPFRRPGPIRSVHPIIGWVPSES